MATASERLQFLVTLDAKGAIKGFNDIGNAADKNLKKAETRIDKLGGNLTKFGAGAVAVAGLAGAALLKAGKSASRLEQAVGATETVFGEASGAVDEFAKTSAKAFGISESAARELTSGIGALLQNFGYTEAAAADAAVTLSKLGADLAAAFGGSPEEAVAALGAALRGENDPVERFGISLNDAKLKVKALELGLYSGVGSLEANAKAQAALALITEQTAKVQGQAAREAGTAAGQQARAAASMEDAMASLGKSVAPVMAEVAGKVADVANAFTAANDATDGFLGKAIGIGAVAVGAAGALSLVAGQAIKMRDAFIVSTEAGGKQLTTLGKVGAALGVAGAAFGVFQAIQASAERQQQLIAQRALEMADALKVETDAFIELRKAAGELPTELDATTAAHAALNAVLNEGAEGDKLGRTLGELGMQSTEAADAILRMKTDTSGFIRELVRAQPELAKVADDVEAAIASEDTWSDVLAELSLRGVKLTRTQEDLAHSIENLQDVAENVDYKKLVDAFFAGEVKDSAFREGLVDQARALVDTKNEIEDNIEAYQIYLGLLADAEVKKAADATADLADELEAGADAASALKDQLGITNDEYSYLADLAGKAADAVERQAGASDRLTDALDDQVSVFDQLESAASGLKSAYDDLTEGAVGVEEATRDIWEGIADFNKQVKTAVDAGDKFATSLDVTSESGRKNREEIQKQYENVVDLAVAQVRAGKSYEDAATEAGYNTEALLDNAEAQGLNRDQLEEYLKQLGYTPETVITAIKLAGQETAKTEAEAIIDQLSTIDKGAEAHISALIAAGDFEALLTFVQLLERADSLRNAFRSGVSGIPFLPPSRPVEDPEKKAFGGPVTAGQPYIVGDGGRPELFVPGQDGIILPQVPRNITRVTQPAATASPTSSAAQDQPDPLEIARRKFERGALSRDAYLKMLQDRQKGLVAYSDEEQDVYDEIQRLNELAAAAKETAAATEAERKAEELATAERVARFEYETGKKSADDYIAFLQARAKAAKKNSDEQIGFLQEIANVEKKLADEREARDRQLVQNGETERDAIEAERQVDEALAALAAAKADQVAVNKDRGSKQEDRDRAAEAVEQARARVLDQVFSGVVVQARRRGLDPKSLQGSVFMRNELSQWGAARPEFAKEIEQYLATMPTFRGQAAAPNLTVNVTAQTPTGKLDPQFERTLMNAIQSITRANGPNWWLPK